MSDDRELEFHVTYSEKVKWCHNFYEYIPHRRTVWGSCPLKERGQNSHCWQCVFNNDLPHELAVRDRLRFNEVAALDMARQRYDKTLTHSLGCADNGYGAELYYQHVETLLSPVSALPSRIEREGR